MLPDGVRHVCRPHGKIDPESSKISGSDVSRKSHRTVHDKHSQEVFPEMGNPQKAGKEWQVVLTRRCDFLESDPYGTRTRVAGVKGRSPRPLDEGAVVEDYRGNVQVYSAMRQVQTK